MGGEAPGVNCLYNVFLLVDNHCVQTGLISPPLLGHQTCSSSLVCYIYVRRIIMYMGTWSSCRYLDLMSRKEDDSGLLSPSLFPLITRIYTYCCSR
jgi:hypothetical protein